MSNPPGDPEGGDRKGGGAPARAGRSKSGNLGRLDRVSKELQKAVHDSLTLTEGNSGLTLSVALDYGGRGRDPGTQCADWYPAGSLPRR